MNGLTQMNQEPNLKEDWNIIICTRDQRNENTLQVIGPIGGKVCYLNISKEEALARYKKDEDNYNDYQIEDVESYEFNDEFKVYDIWESKLL